MRGYVLFTFLVVCIAQFECRSLTKRQTQQHIDPSHDAHKDESLRDKRKVEATFGVKNAILGFVFNPKSKGFAWETTTRAPKLPTTTEDIVIFEKDQKVSLDIPGELFGSSFTLVTNISNTVGDLMMNTAFRAQRLLESMRPLLRAVFGAKGFVIEGSTDKPIFSPPETSTSS